MFKFSHLLAIVLLCDLLLGNAAEQEATIQWHKGRVEQAFALAKQRHKPIFLYWGAAWCPPCNQLKATVFKNPSFIEKTRLFVPVYLDGDTEAAQRWGERFGVLGYPTLILFNPEGEEITRLPGGMDLERYPQMLDLALEKTRPVARVLDELLSTQRPLTRDEAHLLAYYSWRQDHGRALGSRKPCEVLRQLIRQTPNAYILEKARLKAAYLSLLANDKPQLTPEEKQRAQTWLNQLLTDSKAVKDNFDFVIHDVGLLINRITVPQSVVREQLSSAWKQALDTLQTASLNPAQRLYLRLGELYWQQAQGQEPRAAWLQNIEQEIAHLRKSPTDGHARVAIAYAAYNLLKAAGLKAQAKQLLDEEIQAGSNNQYWLLVLANLAKEDGQADEALDWYAQAWAQAQGPATKLQWGSYYIRELTELTPDNEEAIIQVSLALFDMLKQQKAPFHGRSKKALERIFKALNAWGELASPAQLIRLKQRFIEACLPFGPKALERCRVIMNTTGV